LRPRISGRRRSWSGLTWSKEESVAIKAIVMVVTDLEGAFTGVI